MALVIFFVPDPSRGVAEMRRVVRAGGTVAAYAWDIEGGGFPYEDIHVAMREVGVEPLLPPRSDVARMEELNRLWSEAGLVDVDHREFTSTRVFPSIEEYWSTATSAPGIAQVLSKLGSEQVDEVHNAIRASRGSGELAVRGRAHAVQGHVTD
jgi:hypothetical protein